MGVRLLSNLGFYHDVSEQEVNKHMEMHSLASHTYFLGGVAEIRMVTMASFLEIIAKDFRNSAHGMSCA